MPAPEKPKLFFSHSSRDSVPLLRLKDKFVEKTGGAIEVFLSSDGQSIKFGSNWVHRIQEALEHTHLMIVFVSPNALRSNWLFFESGFAYARDIRVVPVAILGVDFSRVPPPLGLLQGFNINSADGLNNIVVIVNEVFSHSHPTSFTAQEYGEIFTEGRPDEGMGLDDSTPFVERLSVFLFQQEKGKLGITLGREEVVCLIEATIRDEGIPYQRRDASHIDCVGMLIELPKGYPDDQLRISFELDPIMARRTFPIMVKAIKQIRSGTFKDTEICLTFRDIVSALHEPHRISARLYHRGISLGSDGALLFRDIAFHLESRTPKMWTGLGKMPFPIQAKAQLRMRALGDDLTVDAMIDLLSLLLESGVVEFSDS